MHTRLVELSQEHSRASKRSNSTPVPSFFVRKRKKFGQASKATQYVRDILCLPSSWCTRPRIPIPRNDRRSFLTENGLLGKIEFSSAMSSKDMILEISRVFGSKVGLTKTEIEDEGKRFNFLFLQRSGVGSRTLCKPSVAESFEWNGKHVASLAKSGSLIYIQALDALTSLQVGSITVIYAGVYTNRHIFMYIYTLAN